jgi:hypothetical protein
LFTVFYNYVNEQAVDYYVYDVVIFCLAVISVFILTLLSYILVKILFFEAPDNVKTFFDQVASFLYNVASLFALMALLTCTYILWIYFGNNPFGLNILMISLVLLPLLWAIFVFDQKKVVFTYIAMGFVLFIIQKIWEYNEIYAGIFAIIVVIVFTYLINRFSNTSIVQNSMNYVVTNQKKLVLISVLIPTIIVGLILITALLATGFHDLSFLHGNIDIEMENSYEISDNPFFVEIYVTGPLEKLEIDITKIEQNYNVKKIDHITLFSENYSTNVAYSDNKSVVGNAASPGNFQLYIDKSNMSAGYYKIECQRLKFADEHYERIFLLK